MTCGTKKGLLFFYIHLITEIVCFYILTGFLSFEKLAALTLVYDFLAFMPQGIFGYILDNELRFHGTLLGVAFLLASLVLFWINVNPFVVIIFLTIASCFIHITGAEHTLRDSNGKMTPSALFVSGGSFGVITGKILSQKNVPTIFVIIICLTILVTIPYLKKHPLDLTKKCAEFNFANNKINPVVLVTLATIVVAVRAFIAYGIPTSWNKELYQAILLYVFMGFGKMLGGFLIDKIGIKWVSFISTICSLPFLIWGDNIMILSIIGVMFFSMTMAVTLALIVSCMKNYPGVAFGMTTIGLFLGTLPIFYFRITNSVLNIALLITLTMVSFLILFIISGRKRSVSL